MTIAHPKWALPPYQKASVVQLYEAARAAYARHLHDAEDAERAASFSTAWHCTKALNLPQPIFRCAVALGVQPLRLLNRVADYYDLERREPVLCTRADVDFQAACVRLTGAELCPRRLRLIQGGRR